MNKKFSSGFVIVVGLAIIGIAAYLSVRTNRAAITQLRPSVTNTHVEQTGTVRTKTDALGFTAAYVTDLFTESNTKTGALLSSRYTVIDNPSGIEGKEIVHNFSIAFEVKQGSVLDIIKSESDYAFVTLFPGGTEKSYIAGPEPGWGKYSAGGRDGYEYTEGLEGINDIHAFLPLSKTETLEVVLKFFDSSVVGMKQPAAQFPMIEQLNAFGQVMDSLEFTTTE